MTRILPVLAALALGCAGAALAQDAPVPSIPDSATDIAPAEWRDLVQGRTVTYRIGDQIWAQEAYDRSTNSVAIRLADGTCMEGTWTHVEGSYCFDWSGGEFSCFRHVRAGEEILIIPVVDGVTAGTIQTVGGVSDLPLSCGPDLTS
ncbi:MAG: hypothetical protein AAGE76_14560 [Pseudomonadota bacterium]